MDPFTQRMLERAKARREKLDTALSNVGHDVGRSRSPLRDTNTIMPVITDVLVKKSPTKMAKMSSSPNSSPKKSPRKSERNDGQIKPNKENDQEDSHVRTKLQRMGKLYSDDNRELLSSPIHRTEGRFAVEEVSSNRASAKPCARLNRLAALASEINNWEDDLSHPVITSHTTTKAERIQAKLNDQVKSGSESSSSSSESIRSNKSGGRSESLSRPVKWDKTMLENLESQGFTRTKSHNRLVFDYKAFSQDSSESDQKSSTRSSPSKSPTKSPIKSPLKSPVKSPLKAVGSNKPSALEKIDERPDSEQRSHMVSSPAPSDSSSSVNKTPEKSTKSSGNATGSPAVSNARINSRFGYNSSPIKNSHVQSPGSVLTKASIFESKNSSETRTKDPAEMSLSERKALFERNRGEALIPKAPLTMSVPTKMLQDKSSQGGGPTNPSKPKVETGRTVEAQRSIFEQSQSSNKRVQELENDILQNVRAERQRELEMLRTRFNRTRDVVQSTINANLRTSESSDQGKPNSPKNSPVCSVKPTSATDQAPPPPPPLPSIVSQSNSTPRSIKSSPVKKQVYIATESSEYDTALSDDQANTETDTEYQPEANGSNNCSGNYEENDDDDDGVDDEDDDIDEDEDIGNTSLGRSILHAVSQQTALHKKRSIEPDPDSTTSDISVLDEMDEYLDECLAVQGVGEEGPTPPKLNRRGKSPSTSSHSFKYTHGSPYRSPIKIVSPATSPKKKSHCVTDGDECMPLMHSIDTYRRQQSVTPKTPARVISRAPEVVDFNSYDSPDDKEAILVQDKVKRLLEEVQKQQTIIGQASQALNLCNSTIEFSGSQEQVEGERLLLVATHRRQAALNEVQRLKVEGTLRPVVPGAPEVEESGSLTISALTLPLKREFFRQLDPDTCLHFVCLVRYLDIVIATPVVRAQPGDSCLRFPSTLKLQDLYSDFKVTIEVYSLQTRAEILPHEIKYHIHSGGSSCSSSSAKKSAKKTPSKTPKKLFKHESKLVMPNLQSPAGPSAVRTTSFSLAGYVVFSLKEVHRQQFTLNKVPPTCPLEERLQMHVSCELTVSVDHHGFLTMFEDISGFGAWHRRWCLLKGATLSYWKYPDDERKKTPIGSLDLQTVTTTNVNLVSRDICARPNTILLETTRPAQPGDTDSLIMVTNGPNTTIRHLLSADTKEDRLEWCAKLNKTLHLIRAWGSSST